MPQPKMHQTAPSKPKQLIDDCLAWLWGPMSKEPRTWMRGLKHALRMLYAVLRDLKDGQLNLRAMSLVYTTLLSLVPILAISFSVLKGFGVHNQIEPALLEVLTPLGEKRFEIVTYVIGFVDNIKVGVLGSVGLALLVYGVVSLMQKMERAFNYTWHVDRGRNVAARFGDYLSVLMVGPFLIFLSMGMTTAARKHPAIQEMLDTGALGGAFEMAALVVPYLLFTVAFSFIYKFMPNTRVELMPAIVGGAVAAVLWKILGAIYILFIGQSAAYAAIYSAFATLVLFMIWLYMGWLILLVGASIAYYVQNPSNMRLPRGEIILSNWMREKLAIMVMQRIGAAYYVDPESSEQHIWTMNQLAKALNVPVRAVQKIVLSLEKMGYLVDLLDNPNAFIPARPLEESTVADLICDIRRTDMRYYHQEERLNGDEDLHPMMAEAEKAYLSVFADMTLKDLALTKVTETKNKTTDKKAKKGLFGRTK